jgi:hypothetical protein
MISRPCGTKGFVPALARHALWRDDQPIVFDPQLYLVAQPALLDERLWNSDAARIADLDQFRPHGLISRVITLYPPTTMPAILATERNRLRSEQQKAQGRNLGRLVRNELTDYGQRLAVSSHPAARAGGVVAAAATGVGIRIGC